MAAAIIVGGGIVGGVGVMVACTSGGGRIHHHIAVRITKLLFHCGPSAKIWCFLTPRLVLVLEDACAVQDVVRGGDDFTCRLRGTCSVANKNGFFNLHHNFFE